MKDFAKQTVENERLSMFMLFQMNIILKTCLGNMVKLGLVVLFLFEVCCIYNIAF